nr:uncharacterized protein LOC115851281 isoform X2 [Globicephala melas]
MVIQGRTLLSLFANLIHMDRVFSLHAESCRGSRQEASKLASSEFLRYADFNQLAVLFLTHNKIIPFRQELRLHFPFFFFFPKSFVLIYLGYRDAIFSFQTFSPTAVEDNRAWVSTMMLLFDLTPSTSCQGVSFYEKASQLLSSYLYTAGAPDSPLLLTVPLPWVELHRPKRMSSQASSKERPKDISTHLTTERSHFGIRVSWSV